MMDWIAGRWPYLAALLFGACAVHISLRSVVRLSLRGLTRLENK
jgi:hypothetical protein